MHASSNRQKTPLFPPSLQVYLQKHKQIKALRIHFVTSVYPYETGEKDIKVTDQSLNLK